MSEIETMKNFQTPHIVKLYDVIATKNNTYII